MKQNVSQRPAPVSLSRSRREKKIALDLGDPRVTPGDVIFFSFLAAAESLLTVQRSS